MKNLTKFIGIIAFVAVIGFSMVSCEIDEKDYEMLNGDWEVSSGVFVVTITNDVGVFKQITGGNFKIALDNGNVRIGDRKFRNIKKTGDLTWSAQERLVEVGTGVLADWADITMTLSANGQTLYTSGSGSLTYTKR